MVSGLNGGQFTKRPEPMHKLPGRSTHHPIPRGPMAPRLTCHRGPRIGNGAVVCRTGPGANRRFGECRPFSICSSRDGPQSPAACTSTFDLPREMRWWLGPSGTGSVWTLSARNANGGFGSFRLTKACSTKTLPLLTAEKRSIATCWPCASKLEEADSDSILPGSHMHWGNFRRTKPVTVHLLFGNYLFLL